MHRAPVELSALTLLATSALIATPLLADDDEPTLLWEATGFDNPESVRVDVARERLYVTNVNGNPSEKDGNGYLSLLSLSGEVLAAHWVDGFDAPKGMALAGNLLYVSDVGRLVVVDVDAAKIVAAYDAPSSKFLNDVTVDEDGHVYVSDMGDNTVYQLDGSHFDVWLRDAALDSPNGLLAEADRLLVASWGTLGEGAAAKLGVVRAVSWEDRSVTALDTTGLGHLDGLEALASDDDTNAGKRYLITDWINGALYTWTEGDGEGGNPSVALTLDFPAGSADIGLMAEEGVVIVPLMQDSVVQAYRLAGDED